MTTILYERGKSLRHQLTGNSGLYHVARELSRRGWHVMPTVRNARGADLYAASDDEATVLPIQSKALSKRSAVPLGSTLDNLRSPWWIITLNANSASPVCYVLTLEEVRQLAARNVNSSGQVSHWLEPKVYAVPEFEEAWHRLGDPNLTVFSIEPVEVD
ncbi:hypothetical protein [Sphingopyxis sp. P8]|uniref:hypothetical protein n=1 Tax=Sphingopyxis sp. P8 TaxID=2763256 RepID=UPI001D09EE74|nr:hypothetical protein [Sphingopyxis sp. P8]